MQAHEQQLTEASAFQGLCNDYLDYKNIPFPRETSTIMARSSHQPSSSLNLWTLPIVNLTLAIGLLAYHVHAEEGAATSDLSLWNRIMSGPEYLTTMDKVAFVVVITLALEILNLLVKNSGGAY
jgi:hypothetical protein